MRMDYTKGETWGSRPVRRYGLIGRPLQHSLSPWIHKRIMEAAGIRGEYRLYELQENELARELPRLVDELDGFNCTIPYKQKVIPFLRSLAPSAQVYGAVNTVYHGVGHNTDGAGLRSCAVPLWGKRVCILGAGGVARVLAVEAAQAGAEEIVIRARRLEQARELAALVCNLGFSHVHCADYQDQVSCHVLLNGTPVGMWPQVGGLPVPAEELANVQAVFDTIYNPTATRLVLKAKTLGLWAQGGLRMLLAQALAAQQIWNPDVDFTRLERELGSMERDLAWEVFRSSPLKLVLSGFMGAGKTHVGRLLAQRLQMPFADLDECVVRRAGQTIPNIFAAQGEEGFRQLERTCLEEELSAEGPLVLAAGGGTVLQQGTVELIHSLGGLVIYLDVPFETAWERCASGGERPLLNRGRESAWALYQRRRPLYAEAADLQVDSGGEDSQVVRAILAAFELEV